MSDDNYGPGSSDAIELQHRLNKLDRLMFEYIRQSMSEDPLERIRRIAKVQTRPVSRIFPPCSRFSSKAHPSRKGRGSFVLCAGKMFKGGGRG